MSNANMTDIAKAAKVSIATVGRVIHNNGYVSEDARLRVEDAVKKLGYVPNRMARTLKQKKSGIIGSMVTYNQNALYTRINNSIIEAVENHGYKLLTMEGRQNRHDEEEILNQFIGMQVDGLVITSNRQITADMLDKLHNLEIPVVMVERTSKHKYTDNLIVRDFEGSYDAVKRMISLGHTRIALIAVELRDSVEEQRYEGYIKALSDSDIVPDKDLICLVNDYSLKDGYEMMKMLLSLSSPPTAVFCTADTLAAGAMQYIYEKQLHVPKDISICGYDNVLAAQLAPPIDSVDLAISDIGESVFSMLSARMQNINAESQTEYLDTVYVSRNTVRAQGQLIVSAATCAAHS